MSLPNPLTPMAFLPPEIAREVTIASFIMVSALTIMLWDMMNSMSADLIMLKSGFSIPLAAYFISRFSMLAFLVGTVVINSTSAAPKPQPKSGDILSFMRYLTAAPIGSCESSVVKVVCLVPVQMAFTTLLFFIRVRATYQNARWVTIVFGILWLAVAGGSTIDVFYHNTNIGPTKYCIVKEIPQYGVVAGIFPLINDTLIFLAITYKLTGRQLLSTSTERKHWFRALVKGEYIPQFSRAVLRDGQAYYLTTIVLYALTIFFTDADTIPKPIRMSINVPCSTLVNIMACRVYRNGKGGRYMNYANDPGLPTIHFAEVAETHRASKVSISPGVGTRSNQSTGQSGSVGVSNEIRSENESQGRKELIEKFEVTGDPVT